MEAHHLMTSAAKLEFKQDTHGPHQLALCWAGGFTGSRVRSFCRSERRYVELFAGNCRSLSYPDGTL